TSFTLHFDEVFDVTGNPYTGSITSIDFSTAEMPATSAPAAPRALYPGPPCATVATAPSELGRCAGGLDDDDAYALARMPRNRAPLGVFHQPMQAQSSSLGQACDQGSVRVEFVNGA